MDTQSLQAPRIALLIDFDNVVLGVEEPPGFDIELVVNALRSRGVIVLGRAYGDWYRHNRHRRKLMEQGIELVETPAFGPIIKNSADIRIALDGFEIGMTQHHITEFCLVSGDSDFLPLIKRLQYLGKTVVVISGVKFTSELVRRNCNEFISYENLLAESVGATEDATVLEGAFALLVRTINTLHERGMEVRSSTVKQMMIQLNPVFSERTFGCSQFKQFLDKGCRAGMIKLGRRDPNSGEYNVLLPGDLDDEESGETTAPEAAPAARSSRRGRGRRVQSAEEDLSLSAVAPETGEAGSEDRTEEADVSSQAEVENILDSERETAGRDGSGRESNTREALRQGRLRSSGRTWKGKATSRSVLPGVSNGHAAGNGHMTSNDVAPAEEHMAHAGEPAADESTAFATSHLEASEEAIAELVAADGGAVAEAEAENKETGNGEAQIENAETQVENAEAEADGAGDSAETAEGKPRRTSRRRRKPPAKKAESAETSIPETGAAGETAEAEAKPAKKVTRRRAPRKKKEEATPAEAS